MISCTARPLVPVSDLTASLRWPLSLLFVLNILLKLPLQVFDGHLNADVICMDYSTLLEIMLVCMIISLLNH